jgi:hypothetical protein
VSFYLEKARGRGGGVRRREVPALEGEGKTEEGHELGRPVGQGTREAFPRCDSAVTSEGIDGR